MSYTKGEWKLEYEGQAIYSTTGRPIASIFTPLSSDISHLTKLDTESLANARLIAAAPVIYEALKAIMYERPLPNELFLQGHIALAKAEGKKV